MQNIELTYFSNSGFALQRGQELLVFDCHNPDVQPLLTSAQQADMQMSVFISHRHGDHYSRDIWKLSGAQFAVGFDVPVNKEATAHTTSFRPGENAIVSGMQVHAFGSTDEGVCFFVQWGDTLLFHAGDLNNWHWRDEGGDDYAHTEEMKFLQELESIQTFQQQPHIAFFPVDPRMGTDYYRGAIQFAKAIAPHYFMPMHFGRTYQPPQAFIEEIAPFTTLLTPPQEGKSMLLPPL